MVGRTNCVVQIKSAGGTPPAPSGNFWSVSAQRRHAVFDDARADKNQKFVLVVHLGVGAEQESDIRQITENRNLGGTVGFGLCVYTADDDRAAILYQHRRGNLFGINRRTCRRHAAYAILMHVKIHDDIVVGRNLWFYLKRQRCFLEGHAGCAARRCLLVGNFRALLYGRFDLVSQKGSL